MISKSDIPEYAPATTYPAPLDGHSLAAVTGDDRASAIKTLHSRLGVGDRVFAIITHVSRSGMNRSIQTLIPRGNEILDISYYVARATQRECRARHGTGPDHVAGRVWMHR